MLNVRSARFVLLIIVGLFVFISSFLNRSQVSGQTDHPVTTPQGTTIPALNRTSTGSPTDLFGATAESANPLMANRALVQSVSAGMTRARITTVNFAPLGAAGTTALTADQIGANLTLNLFDGITLVAVREKIQRNASGSYTWIGHIDGVPLSQAIFVVRAGALYAGIQAPGIGEFAVQPLDGNYHLIQQAGPNTILPEDDTHLPPADSAATAAKANPTIPAVSNAAAATAGSTADNGSLIDVLVVYSDDVNDANAQSFAELFMAYTNQAYENSNVNQRVWLVDVEEFAYNETGNLSTDLGNITNNANPNVLAYRNQYHADLVVFFVNNDGSGSGSCSGLAWLQTSVNINFEDNGYSTMKACSFGSSVFAHELGHNMGSRHDWYMDNGTTPFSYAHGYVDTVNRFRTIMSYNNRCSALGFSCAGIPYFSNPTVNYNGATTGVAGGTSSACAPNNANPAVNCDADERRTLNETATNTSNFRSSQLTWTGAVNNQWGTAGNWTINEGVPGATVVTNRVPRAFDNIFIPSGVATMPTISSGTVTAREVVIANGATLNMTGGTLTVGLRWEDAGGFNGTGGTVIFNGPLDIAITSATASAFNHVQIGDGISTPEITLNSNVEINGNLTIKAGALLKPGANTMKLAGNWSDEGNGFARGTSTVELDGVNQSVDKVSTTTILTQDFSAYTSCCTSGAPSGWARSHSDGFGIAFGDGVAQHWWDSTDGWLFTSGLTLQPGITYNLSFKYLKGSGSTSSLAVAYGTAQTAGTMVNTVGTVTNLTTAYQTANFSFTPTAAGTYYIGFHSLQTGGYNTLDDIVLQAVQQPNFYNLSIKSTGRTILNQPVEVYHDLQILSGGSLDLSTNALTVEGTMTNNGTLKQTKNATANVLTEFLHIKNGAGTTDKYFGVEITPGGNLGSTTVAIRGNQSCTEGGGATNTVKRCFDITPTTVQSAQIRFYYRTAEQNSNATPQVYHYSGTGSSWELENFVARGGSGEALWVTANSIDSYSPFRLADTTAAPTATATATATPVSTATGTATSLPTATGTATTLPTATSTATALSTATGTVTPLATATGTATALPTPTSTATPLATATATVTPLSTPTGTATALTTATATATPLSTATGTATALSTATGTATPLATATGTATVLPTATATVTPLSTATGTATTLPTATSTATALSTATGTATVLPTATATATPLSTVTRTATALPMATSTATPFATATSTATPTATPTSLAGTKLFLSSSANGIVDGLAFRDEDILAYTIATNSWSLLFDGSDVGVGNTNLAAFHFLPANAILLSFGNPINLPGLGKVDDSDIVRFTYSQLGATTVGTFSLFIDGSDVGLSTAGERIDAIAFDAANRLIISTDGTIKVGALSGQDEDLFALTLLTSGAETSGTWAMYFDGSDVGLTNGSEDVNAVWIEPGSGRIYLGTKGNLVATGSVNTITGDKNSIVSCAPLLLGDTTDCTFAPFFDGDTARFAAAFDGFGLSSAATAATEAVVVTGEGSSDTAADGPQYELAVDDAASELDAELDEYDQRVDEEVLRYFFLPLISR